MYSLGNLAKVEDYGCSVSLDILGLALGYSPPFRLS